MVDKEYTIGKQDLWMQDKFGDQKNIITYNSKALNKPEPHHLGLHFSYDFTILNGNKYDPLPQ